SEVWGLAGVRTTLIPHQLYIAHEVANRFAPRAGSRKIPAVFSRGLRPVLHRKLYQGVVTSGGESACSTIW
nr:hypothetical protein [Anaerolineae bacterium]